MEQCSQCHNTTFIVNRKYHLCDECNYKRLHNGISKAEVYQQKQSGKVRKPTYVKKITQKQAEINKFLSDVKKNITKQAIENNEYYCHGCNKATQQLDHSHILSVKHRADLQLDENNINLFCRECHKKWESGDIEKQLSLLTFEKDLMYIKQHDSYRYNRLFSRLSDYILQFHTDEQIQSEICKKAYKIYSENDYIPM